MLFEEIARLPNRAHLQPQGVQAVRETAHGATQGSHEQFVLAGVHVLDHLMALLQGKRGKEMREQALIRTVGRGRLQKRQ